MTVTPKDNHVPCSESPCCSPKGLEPHISHSMALTSSSQDSAPSLLAPPLSVLTSLPAPCCRRTKLGSSPVRTGGFLYQGVVAGF